MSASEAQRVRDAAEALAAAISRRDIDGIRQRLAPDFLHRTPGGAARDAGAFLAAIQEIPGEILFVRLHDMEVDFAAGSAFVTGIQHAEVRIDGETYEDRRAFVDWFTSVEGEWRVRVAVDLPTAPDGE
jgi:ketosteroid isomerase-like protein